MNIDFRQPQFESGHDLLTVARVEATHYFDFDAMGVENSFVISKAEGMKRWSLDGILMMKKVSWEPGLRNAYIIKFARTHVIFDLLTSTAFSSIYFTSRFTLGEWKQKAKFVAEFLSRLSTPYRVRSLSRCRSFLPARIEVVILEILGRWLLTI